MFLGEVRFVRCLGLWDFYVFRVFGDFRVFVVFRVFRVWGVLRVFRVFGGLKVFRVFEFFSFLLGWLTVSTPSCFEPSFNCTPQSWLLPGPMP